MYGNPFVWLIDTIITIFIYLLIAQAILTGFWRSAWSTATTAASPSSAISSIG